ncbi:MAG: metallophosphoesterase family protein [Candidatus Paceibacteria bacterium]
MKIIAIGDIHGNPIWKDIVNKEIETTNKFVFTGDYFDSFVYTTEEQCRNFLDIIAFKKENPLKVVLLWGNHDDHYRVGDSGTSGYQAIGKFQIERLIEYHIELFDLVHQHGTYLFSHAGVSPVFLDQTFGKDGWTIHNFITKLNDMFEFKPGFLQFNGSDSTGDDPEQSPIWIRPKSLMKANKDSLIRKNFVQIVGHTKMKKIDVEGRATGLKYAFIDTLNTNKEYLIIDGGSFRSGKI